MGLHTSGPWEASPHAAVPCRMQPDYHTIDAERIYQTATRPGIVADTLNRNCVIDPDEDRANARLMAAAPDLLRALQWYVDFAGEPCKPGEFGANLCQHRDCETVRTARAAIAKATAP
jgi:hypothetical protein